MQESDLIRETNQAKLYFEPSTLEDTGTIVMQGANPKLRLYPRQECWIDVPLFI